MVIFVYCVTKTDRYSKQTDSRYVSVLLLSLEKVPGKGAFFFSAVWNLNRKYAPPFSKRGINMLKIKYYCEKGISAPMRLW